jgi:hypothetical protein
VAPQPVSTCASVAARTLSDLYKRRAYKRLARADHRLDQDGSGAPANKVCDRDRCSMHCVAECRDVRLSYPIEPFDQLIENGIGTGEIE